MNSKGDILDLNSRSLPSSEFPIISISSADSGIDSDTSVNTSSKLTNSLEEIETEDDISPQSFLLGETANDSERIDGINKAIDWIKEELIKMKRKDKQLTKAMITIRSSISEYKLKLEKRDTGYDSDSETSRIRERDQCLKEKWRLIAKDSAFPADGILFENNKRATWAI